MKTISSRGRPSFVDKEFSNFLTANKRAIKGVANHAEAYDLYSIWTSNSGNHPMCEASFRKKFRDVKINPVSVEKAKKQSVLSLAEQFASIEDYIGLIQRGIINSLYICGLAGIGKTDVVKKTLKKLKANMVYYNGGIKDTYSLVRTLYKNRNKKVIVFDDLDKINANKDMCGILKSALQDEPVRTITWLDTTHHAKKDIIPEQFEFTSTVIFISNRARLDPAIKDRSIPMIIHAENGEILEWIHLHFNTFLPKIPMEFKEEVYEFIKANINRFDTMSYRKFKQITTDYLLYSAKGDDDYWKRVVLQKFKG